MLELSFSQMRAVVENGQIYYIRTDHIGRPVYATDSTGAKVWEVSYLPFGGVHTSTGKLKAFSFPGQWFQSESGLHQNWMRDYDPTTGRYMQADPLGLVDGASVYGYVSQNPGRYVDPRGEESLSLSSTFGKRIAALAGTAAISDGPVPIGDAIGLCLLGAAATYCYFDGALCSQSTDWDGVGNKPKSQSTGKLTGAKKKNTKDDDQDSKRKRNANQAGSHENDNVLCYNQRW